MRKSDLLDHISDAFNILNSKFGRCLHFLIAGDTNKFRWIHISDTSPLCVQIVSKPTRIDRASGKKTMLYQVIMTLSHYYQEPQILAPLDADPDNNDKPSDHNIVLVNPICAINNKVARNLSNYQKLS